MTDRRTFLTGVAASLAASTARAATPRLRDHLLAEMRKQLIPGLQIAVVRKGEIVFRDNLGLADIENNVPVTAQTVFQIASITKAFVGVALMQLVEDGALDLEAPVSRYLENLPPAWRAVTIAQAATHTSGLPEIFNIATLRLIVDGDAGASWTRVQALLMEFSPGEKFSYNQTNYVVLGKIIDHAAGMPFADFIQKRQLDITGMPKTVWGDDHDIVMHSARSYTPYALVDGKPARTTTLTKAHTEFPAIMRTCAGMNSTAEEIARWLIALEQGRLFRNPATLAMLRTPRALNSGKPGAWGIGGWAMRRAQHPLFFSVGAAKSAFAVYTEDDLAVVALTNLSADMWLPFMDGIAGHYIPGLGGN